MNEPGETPRSQSIEPRAISPEIIEKLSKGVIELTPNLIIKGEGEDRKLHITISPEDPTYIAYDEDLKKALKYTAVLSRRHKNGQIIDEALDDLKSVKNRLPHIQNLQIKGYIATNEGYFAGESSQIPNDGSEESVTRRENLDSEKRKFTERSDYIKHLVSLNRVKLILPGEKPVQAPITGKTET